jgi:hypothetical protein
MRRVLLALALSFAVMAHLTAAAVAVGPGGWDHLGHGATAAVPALNGAVYALNSDNPGVLYAGGAFTDAGGNANADHIARWNGTAWTALGAVTLNGAVDAIAYHAGKVYVGGVFTNVSGNANLDFLAAWNGTTWSSPCTTPPAMPAVTASVAALQIIGNTLYIGGSFQNGAGILTADYLLACDLTTGVASSTVPSDGDINGGIYALTSDSNGTLYAGGLFINLRAIPAADHVASYRSGTWHAMGSGPAPAFAAVDSIVRSLAAHGTDVYIGTDAVNVGQIPTADHVAKWNAATLAYSAMGSNTAGADGWLPASAFIYTLATSGSLVFAAGSFQNANGQATADEIAWYDGVRWRPLGSNGAGNGPLGSQANALAVYNHRIVAGGNFLNGGGDGLADFLGSYAILRPDARIGVAAAGPFVGNNVYSSTGVGESKAIGVPRGMSGTLYADIQNDGLVADTFLVHGTGTASGFSVAYFTGTTNVTTQVKAGTFSTGRLAPGAHRTIRVVVKVAATSAASATFLIRATSAPGTQPDAVKAVVKAN